MRSISPFLALFLFQTLYSLPHTSSVVQGEATLKNLNQNQLEISASDQAVIHWDDFSIEREELVRFIQPDASSLVLNRVISEIPSNIFGRLESNGRLVLINPNGILVGREAVIDTASFTASSFDAIDEAVSSRKSLASAKGRSLIIQGTIRANGEIHLSGGAIQNDGVLEASTVHLYAGSNIWQSGSIKALSASGVGGEVHIFGSENHLSETARIDASGKFGGGTVLIGGDYQGESAHLSTRTTVDKSCRIEANALDTGNGGKIIIWGEEAAGFDGIIEARGGPIAGNGGLVEISSRGFLSPLGSVDTRAPFGKNGKLLLDPTTVVISTDPDSGILTSPPPGYVFNASPANIKVQTLKDHLNMNDVIINATASGPGGIGSITLNADADMPMGQSIFWNSGSATTLTLIANGFINIRNGILSQDTTASPTTPIIQVSAPVVTIGDSSLTLANPAILQVVTGQIQVNAPTSLSIYGNTASLGGILAGTGAPTDLGTVEVNAGTLSVQSGSVQAAILANGDIDVRTTGNMQFMSGADSSGIITFNAASTLSVIGGGNLSFQGGNGATSSSAIIANNGGTIDIAIAGDYFLQGGSAGMGMDGNTGISVNGGSGTIRLSGRNYFLTGGTGLGINSNISAIGLTGATDGTVDVTATGSSGIVCTGNESNGAGILSQTMGFSNILVRTTHLTLNGSTSPTAFQGGAQISVNTGDITVLASGDISLNGGGGINVNIAGIINNGSGSTTVSANNLQASGGTGTFSFAGVLGMGGPVTVNIGGNYLLRGGSGPSAFALIASAATSGSGDLTVNGRNFTVEGGSALQSSAGFFTGDVLSGSGGGNGSIFLTSTAGSGISLTGGTGALAHGAIGTYGTLPTNSINITAPNLTLNSPGPGPGPSASATIFSDAGGDIDIAVQNNVLLTDTTGNLSSIVMRPGGTGNMLIRAGHSVSVNSAIENLGTGNLFIVVDASFPSFFLGGGGFNLGASGVINTAGGLIQIYTVSQLQNSISGFLNGVSFSRGQIFVNSPSEIWCTYFPSGPGAYPFTIFYKECLQELAYQANLISIESLDDLHPANENPGWFCEFTMESKEADPDNHFLANYFIRRRYLKTIDLPKSYTEW